MLRRLIARLRYGSVLAVDEAWRAAHLREVEARRRHQATAPYRAEKARLIHAALAAAVRR